MSTKTCGSERGNPAAPLFCTLAGRPMDQSYIRHLLPRLGRKAGIERRVHAHGSATPSR
ncbi:MAG TPA: hypothetical protein VMK83_07500 [Gaiellaceae bacterium]|nr:hypothetical protein [Gaiellaceae bacterium]